MRITSYWRQWTQMSFLEMGVISRAVGIWAQAVSSRMHDGMCLWDGTTSQDQLDWSWAGLCGALLDTESFHVSHFLFEGKGFRFLDLPRVPKGIFKHLLTGGRKGRQEETLLQQGAWCWSLLGWWASCLCMPWSSSAGTRAPQPRQRRSLQAEHKQVDPHWLGRLMTEMAGTRPGISPPAQSEGKFHTLRSCPNFTYNSSAKPIREFGFFEYWFLLFSLVWSLQ